MESIIKNINQNYANYCRKKGFTYDRVLYVKSNEDVMCFNNSGEEVKLGDQETIDLRDAFLKVDQKVTIINKDWLKRFTSKYGLSYRRITHLCLKTPAELENDVIDFLSEVHKIRKDLDIPLENILNFDEMALYYDQIPSYSYDKKGIAHPLLKVSKLHKKRITVGLTITATGEKLQPLLIFKGKGSKINKLNNFNDYFVRKNENAWNTNKIFLEYIHHIIRTICLESKKKRRIKKKKFS